MKKKRKKEEKSKKKSKKGKKAKKAKKVAKSKKESKKKRKKKQKKVSSASSSSSSDSSASDAAADSDVEVWVEKSDGEFKKPDAAVRSSTKAKKSNDKDESGGVAGDDDEPVGPSVRNTSGLSLKDFGHALLPGEGAAMVC